ncbi:hypothetical protein BK702_09880 [Bacillus thuringiensis serovar cameroun]|nr:hypothetical protein BK702_09880 [Bacillus thuringiensis serovar cameroun]
MINMKFKNFYKFLTVLTLLIPFIMISFVSHADTNERPEIGSGITYKIISALDNNKVVTEHFELDENGYYKDPGDMRTVLWDNSPNTRGAGESQKWRFDYYANKQAYKLVLIYGVQSSMAWNPYSKSDNYRIETGNLDSNDDRYYWILEDTGNGYYYIKNKGNSKYMDVQRERTANGTPIIVYDYNGDNNQKFKLERQ